MDESIDLSAKSREVREITDERLLEIMAEKHLYRDDGKIFHIAIIDYLQEYNCKKKAEKWIMPIIRQVDVKTISVAKPNSYAFRFLTFMENLVFT